MNSYFFFLLCALGVSVETKTKLGDVVPLCSLNDVNINDCLKKSSQNILPTLAKGVKDWHLIGLDPIVIPTIIIGQDTGPISLRWEHTNTTILGYSRVKVMGATVSKSGNLYDFAYNVTVPKLSMIGDYKARGRMLLFPLNNEGHEEIHSGAALLRITFDAKPEKKHNEEYLKIRNLVLKFEFSKDVKVLIRSNNKKPTSTDKIMSRFLTDNVEEIVTEMKPTFEAAFGEIIKNYVQTFFDRIPVKDLFKK